MRPTREKVSRGRQTYFVSSQTIARQPFFRHERWAVLLQEILEHYRGSSYLLHAYVIMPDHFHALLSPQESLERAMQNIKGGFSFRARSVFAWRHDIWQAGFSDHRIRDFEDWQRHVTYIRHNPTTQNYRYLALSLDPIPQQLNGEVAPPLQKQEQ